MKQKYVYGESRSYFVKGKTCHQSPNFLQTLCTCAKSGTCKNGSTSHSTPVLCTLLWYREHATRDAQHDHILHSLLRYCWYSKKRSAITCCDPTCLRPPVVAFSEPLLCSLFLHDSTNKSRRVNAFSALFFVNPFFMLVQCKYRNATHTKTIHLHTYVAEVVSYQKYMRLP